MNSNSGDFATADTRTGGYIGSVAIDSAFEELVRSRLELANRSKPLGLSSEEIEDLAWSVRESDEYQTTKCDYGSNTNTQLPTFTCPLGRLSPDYSNPNYKISNGSITFARYEFPISTNCLQPDHATSIGVTFNHFSTTNCKSCTSL